MDLFPFSGDVWENLICWACDVQMQFPKRCVILYFLEYQTKDKVQKSSNPEGTYELGNYKIT